MADRSPFREGTVLNLMEELERDGSPDELLDLLVVMSEWVEQRSNVLVDDRFRPGIKEVARLLSFIEVEMPEDAPLVAAMCLLSARADEGFRSDLERLAGLAVDAGWTGLGAPLEGLTVAEELEELLAAGGAWESPADVLGEEHTPLEELLSMANARLRREDGNGQALRILIGRLERAMAESESE